MLMWRVNKAIELLYKVLVGKVIGNVEIGGI